MPFILVSEDPDLKNARLRKGLGLSSIAPTVLALLGVEKPPEMTGADIIVR